MPLNKKLIAAVLALAMLLTACGGGGGASSGKDKDTLTIAMAEDATTMDPVIQNNIYSENVVRQIFDTLIARKPDGEMENRLAESIEQPDETSYVVKLRSGVKFSSGEELTSEDVAFSLDRASKSDSYAYIFEKIDPASYDTSDPAVLKFKLKEPDVSFKAALAHPAASIVSKKAVEADPDKAEREPVGTGPFKLEDWSKLNSLTLAANDEYWGEKPAFNKMVFRIIPEASNRVIELESGQADLALEIAPNDIKKIEENDKLALHRKMDNSVHFAGFNMTRAPFDNPKAREAVYSALDIQAIIDSVYMGAGKVATGPINPNFEYSISDSLEPTKRDIEKAKQLLQEAGVEEGQTVKLYVSQQQVRKDMATIIKSQLEEVGLNVEITALEWGTFVNALEAKEHDIFIMSWAPSVVDPHYTLFSPYHTKNMGAGPNYMYYSNPELDALIDKGLAVEGDERAEVYKSAQELIMKDKPVVYALYGEQLIGTQKNVSNFDPDPSGSNEYYHITFQ
ncbi:Glutathione-binding protein gsiB precursor [Aedoeadaptatus ivorii]|uniref:Glutathione-binding protein gsiB n=1 Tax=Aedoeadaptatus ivorii TaxID=54006 RepID=A0A3S5AIK6_9FIRM|nr:ABC transporter substrate-binding protein [Peptoniphilus ivorii]VEJ34957.1 Glutathione-binding protein gsiB precursor [Peptoniphilus ivorii]